MNTSKLIKLIREEYFNVINEDLPTISKQLKSTATNLDKSKAGKEFNKHHASSMGGKNMGTPAELDTYDFDDDIDSEAGVQTDNDTKTFGYEPVTEGKLNDVIKKIAKQLGKPVQAIEDLIYRVYIEPEGLNKKGLKDKATKQGMWKESLTHLICKHLNESNTQLTEKWSGRAGDNTILKFYIDLLKIQRKNQQDRRIKLNPEDDTVSKFSHNGTDTEYIKNLIKKYKPAILKALPKTSPAIQESLPVKKWVKASNKDLKQYEDEIYDMIKKSYAYLGGHPNFQSKSDVNTSDANVWDIIDVDGDDNPDAVSAAKQKSSGIKYVMGATDGSREGKHAYLTARINMLKKGGHYVEVSGKPAEILLAKGVPVVKDEQAVRKVLKGKDLEWVGDGWYIRKIGGTPHKKIMLGKPKI